MLDLKNIKNKLKGIALLKMSIAFSLLLIFIWYSFIYLPLADEKAAATAELAQKTNQQITLANFQNEHLDMAAYEEMLLASENNANNSLPDEIAASEFISTIQQLALANNLKIQKITPQEIVTNNNVSECPLNVTVTAGYFDLLNFLAALKESPRFMLVKAADITAKNGVLTCTLTISIYAMPDKQ